MASKHQAGKLEMPVPRRLLPKLNDLMGLLIVQAGGMTAINDCTGMWLKPVTGDVFENVIEPVVQLTVYYRSDNAFRVAHAARDIALELLRQGEQQVLMLLSASTGTDLVTFDQSDLQPQTATTSN